MEDEQDLTVLWEEQKEKKISIRQPRSIASKATDSRGNRAGIEALTF